VEGCYTRQREEEAASLEDHHIQASAQFEQDLQTLQASMDAEFGKDSDGSGEDELTVQLMYLLLSPLSLTLSLCSCQ
jgi:hypothetical protein